MESKFSLRKCVSLTLGLSFLVMTVTGFVLFVVPKGRVAYWSDWTLFGLGKDQWADLHITSMLLLVVSGVWHIYYNWTPLVGYLKNSAKRLTPLKKEFLAALVLNLAFVLGTLYHVVPFQTLLNLNDSIKSYWEQSAGNPPYGHAEESSLKSFARYIGKSPDAAVALLQKAGMKVTDAEQSLREIATLNAVTPQKVYDALNAGKGASKSSAPVQYLGRRSLAELSEMQVIDLEKSLEYLKKNGLDDASEMKMREIADHFQTTPYEMFERLQKISGLSAKTE